MENFEQSMTAGNVKAAMKEVGAVSADCGKSRRTNCECWKASMPDEFKLPTAVESYRAYYHSKSHFARWTRREVPGWWHA